MDDEFYPWNDPNAPSSSDSPSPPLPDSPPPPRPPEPEGDPPPSPEEFPSPLSLLEWAYYKLLYFRDELYCLLKTVGFMQEENTAKFHKVQRAYGIKALSDRWLDSFWPGRVWVPTGQSSTSGESLEPSAAKKALLEGGSPMAFVPSTSGESSSLDESSLDSMDFGSSVSSLSQASFLIGESSVDSELNVPSEASSRKGESSADSELNVPSTSEASSSKGESSESQLPTASRKRKHSKSPPIPDPDEAIRIGEDLALRSDRVMKEVDDFCAKYIRLNAMTEEMIDTLISTEKKYVSKRRKVMKMCSFTQIEKFVRLQYGVKELRFLADKIVKLQNNVRRKLHYILRRKKRLDQLYKRGFNLTSMERIDNQISYSMYWMYSNFVVIQGPMVKKQEFHRHFETVVAKVTQQLAQF